MALKGTMFAWEPRTASDALDGGNVGPGAMMALTNLTPSMDTRGLWRPRPASQVLVTFTGNVLADDSLNVLVGDDGTTVLLPS